MPKPASFSTQEQELLDQAKVFAFEANFELSRDTSSGIYRGKRTLLDEVDEPLFQAAKLMWSELQLDALNITTVRPWWAAFLMMNRLLIREGFIHTNGVDYAILQLAKTTGRKLFFLEPVGAGMEPFSKAPLTSSRKCSFKSCGTLPREFQTFA